MNISGQPVGATLWAKCRMALPSLRRRPMPSPRATVLMLHILEGTMIALLLRVSALLTVCQTVVALSPLLPGMVLQLRIPIAQVGNMGLETRARTLLVTL